MGAPLRGAERKRKTHLVYGVTLIENDGKMDHLVFFFFFATNAID